MISVISGTIYSIKKTKLVVMTAGGVGYGITVSLLHGAELHKGDAIELPVYLRVTEQALDLFGFRTVDAKSFFELLLSVSGVGPKSAMNILNLGSIDEIKQAIARKDVAYLTAVQGMGKKTAERLVVELKNKIGTIAPSATHDQAVGEIMGDAIEGLVSMGYSKEDARAAVSAIEPEGKSVEQLLKEALQQLAT